jgi:hypothetical protein
MKQLEFKPAVDFEQYGKIPLKESLSVNLPEKDSTGYNLLINSKKTSEVQEKNLSVLKQVWFISPFPSA